MIVETPNLVQTTNGFKRVVDVVVGDVVLSDGVWKEVTSPPEKCDALRCHLTAGFPIIVERKALLNPKQSAFVTTKYRRFSDNFNIGFYAIPYLFDSGFIRVPKGDSRLYNSITYLTKNVGTPNGVIGYLRPVKIAGEDFSLGSCLEVLESLVNRGFRVTRKDDVILKYVNEFGALCLSLLGIDIWSDEESSLVAPHSTYRLFGMLRNVDVNIPNYLIEKSIHYNSNESEGYYQTVKKERVYDWCLKGLRPDINGVCMRAPAQRNYWSRLINGKRKSKSKISKTNSSN